MYRGGGVSRTIATEMGPPADSAKGASFWGYFCHFEIKNKKMGWVEK